MKTRAIILCLILLWLMTDGKLSGKPFTQRPDSLRMILAKATSSESIAILNALANWYAPVDFDSSIMYSAQAMRLGTVHGDQVEVGIARLNTGNAYYYQLDFNNALISYLAAAKILEENGARKEAGDVYLQLGNINFFVWNSEKSFINYHKAKECFISAGDEESLTTVFDALSMSMYFLKYPIADSALIYGFRMLENTRKFNNSYKEVYALMQIGMFYEVKNTMEEKQKALSYADSAILLATERNYQGLKTIAYIIYGDYYDGIPPLFEVTDDPAKARHYYTLALENDIADGSSYLQLTILNDLARIDLSEKKYEVAEEHLKTCEARMDEFFNSRWKSTDGHGYIICPLGKVMDYFMAMRERMNMYNMLFVLSEINNKPGMGIEYLNSYYSSRDDFFSSTLGQQLELMMTEAEAEKTEQKIRMLSQENELKQLRLNQSLLAFAGGGGLIIFSSLFILMFIHRKRSKAEQKSVLMEQRLLRAQMNPHFLFNSLASIQNYILNERPDEASTYLSRFSQLVRDVLDNSVEEFVLLRNEINAITNYLELQKARYEDQFVYSLEVDNVLDEDGLLVPPMLAQPFIENAIEHGIKYKETTGHINIRFMAGGDLIWFEVEDDGVGREKALEIESKHKTKHRSMSTSITVERLGMLGKKFRKKIKLEIIDLKDDRGIACGTKVTFRIPVLDK
ncbi:MAG: histidine kinase [Bacteroidales bacterium]|nr:histidine kinase [Bacteroidales bacterium]